jgi:hypothetical protein
MLPAYIADATGPILITAPDHRNGQYSYLRDDEFTERPSPLEPSFVCDIRAESWLQ